MSAVCRRAPQEADNGGDHALMARGVPHSPSSFSIRRCSSSRRSSCSTSFLSFPIFSIVLLTLLGISIFFIPAPCPHSSNAIYLNTIVESTVEMSNGQRGEQWMEPRALIYHHFLIRTVKVDNVSLGTSEKEIKEFFSFSGDIECVEMQRNEGSQVAYVTFRDARGAETALLRKGATILNQSIAITSVLDCQPSPCTEAQPIVNPAKQSKAVGGSESAVQKAKDVVSSMLAKGFILGKDALNRAKAFDEKHQLTSTATSKVSSLDKKIGFSEKITTGASLVNAKVLEMHQKFQVSEKTKSAFAAAQQKVSNTGPVIMKNWYVLSGASWVNGAFKKVAKAAGEVGSKTKEKVVIAEEEQKRVVVDDFVQVHLSESPKSTSAKENKAVGGSKSAVQKAEDVISSMLAKGSILGNNALNKAKAFDEKHQLTSTATSKVSSLDKKIGFSEKITTGASLVNVKVREMHQKFQVSEKTKSAFAVAQQKVSNTGPAIMKNRYVLTGASWVNGAFNKVAKAAGEVGSKTKEKVVIAEEEH